MTVLSRLKLVTKEEDYTKNIYVKPNVGDKIFNPHRSKSPTDDMQALIQGASENESGGKSTSQGGGSGHGLGKGIKPGIVICRGSSI